MAAPVCAMGKTESELVLRPVDVFDQLFPLLVDGVGSGSGVAVVVGGFLHIIVVPCAGLAVGPGQHAFQHVLLAADAAVQDAVDHGHGLRTLDVLVGLEGVVGIAVNPAVAGSQLDVGTGPVSRVTWYTPV